ncbi:MAG: AAA family ATPase [Chloroflexi bacterium]|nr:AAA family ATPase [Chloroflexota bacterium]
MTQSAPAILITGKPGVGKTTIVRKVIEQTWNMGGFYTREVQENGKRMGFEIVSLEGEVATLATKAVEIRFNNQVMLGNYKVNIDSIDLLAVPAIEKAIENNQIVVIDEIGPMELFSENFRNIVMKALKNDRITVFGTIVERSNQIADTIKTHPRVTLLHVEERNREEMYKLVISLLEAIL